MILTNKILCVCDKHCDLMKIKVSINNLLSFNIHKVHQLNIILFLTSPTIIFLNQILDINVRINKTIL